MFKCESLSLLNALMNSAPPAAAPATNSSQEDNADARSESVRTIASDALLGGQRAVKIEHLGTHYVLRVTRGGKLILTK